MAIRGPDAVATGPYGGCHVGWQLTFAQNGGIAAGFPSGLNVSLNVYTGYDGLAPTSQFNVGFVGNCQVQPTGPLSLADLPLGFHLSGGFDIEYRY